MNKKGQSAVEFIIVIGAVLFFFISFMYALELQKADDLSEKRNLEVKEIVLSLKDEISLASEASDGYSRSFKIHPTISGFLEYDISINNNLIYAETEDNKYSMAFPTIDVTGQPIKGDNKIRKTNGQIFLNE